MKKAKYIPAALADLPVPIPALNDNYIWAFRRGDYALLVDPGEAQAALDWLALHGLKLAAILLTHHHGDHVGGVKEILNVHPAPVWGPATERLPVCDVRVKQDDLIHIPHMELSLTVLDIPGHTAGHVAYYGINEVKQSFVFCGDTLFAGGCGRLFEGTPTQMLASLDKLAALPANTLICCAHEYTQSNLRWALAVEAGNVQLQQRWQDTCMLREQDLATVPSTLETEQATNPFLRTRQAAVMQAAEHYAGHPLKNAVEVFAQLREWKNTF